MSSIGMEGQQPTVEQSTQTEDRKKIDPFNNPSLIKRTAMVLGAGLMIGTAPLENQAFASDEKTTTSQTIESPGQARIKFQNEVLPASLHQVMLELTKPPFPLEGGRVNMDGVVQPGMDWSEFMKNRVSRPQDYCAKMLNGELARAGAELGDNGKILARVQLQRGVWQAYPLAHGTNREPIYYQDQNGDTYEVNPGQPAFDNVRDFEDYLSGVALQTRKLLLDAGINNEKADETAISFSRVIANIATSDIDVDQVVASSFTNRQ